MIYVILADGFEEIEALSVVDILRRANIDVKTVSIGDGATVVGAHNIKVVADIIFENIGDDINMIVLPGGMPGTKNLEKHLGLRKLLEDTYNKNKYIAAICAAPMVLGKLGMLNEKKATCYPSFEKYLNGALVSSDRVCIHDNVITSRGPGTASEFAMSIVELLKDTQVKEKLLGDMLYE